MLSFLRFEHIMLIISYVGGEQMAYDDQKFEAYLDKMDMVTVLVPKSYYDGEVNSLCLMRDGQSLSLKLKDRNVLHEAIKYECYCQIKIEIGEEYQVVEERGAKADLKIGAVIRTPEFDDAFFYNESDLGVVFTKQHIQLKLWAPTATDVKVKLINPKTLNKEYIGMARMKKGVWTAICGLEKEGHHYSYEVTVNGVTREAVDPYAIAASANSEYGVLVNLHKTKQPPVKKAPLQKPTDAIIYEVHIRDFTIHPSSNVSNKGTYAGFTESSTESGVTTGLAYLKELGITHLELLPVNDFDGVDELKPLDTYNWGYNPLLFNVPEGSYSLEPTNPIARILELKQLIRAVHENDLRVILDVVYNHVYVREDSSFEKIVPGYYFRHDQFGMPSNGTGVGNDFASERKMARKFIVDSVLFWVKEYDVDGFRFDLMGILDIETMNTIRQKLFEYDSSILLFGEGWDLNTPLSSEQKATIYNSDKVPHIGFFNDRFRDFIKGSTFNIYDKGFICGNTHRVDEVKQVMAGSVSYQKGEKYLFVQPTSSINYVESHDNHTLWDKLSKCNSHEEKQILQKRQKLASAMVLLAQGIPFLHAGQEFYRTKQGVENSYRSPDSINQFDWEQRKIYNKDIKWLQAVIQLRKAHGAFRFHTTERIRKHMKFLESVPEIVAYALANVEKYGPWKDIIVAFNQDTSTHYINLPQGSWNVVIDGESAYQYPFPKALSGEAAVPAVGVLALFKT